MHYVIGDIHNDLKKLKQILKQINITRDDELIVLGDVFDRGGETADPFGVYCALAGLQGKCSWIRGNHDDWLANYTYEYFNTPEKKRHKLAPYGYNSFELLRQRITEVDMRNIADLIKGLPLQKELELEGKKYLLIDFWASWCGPCRREIPNLKNLYKQYAEKGFQIVSISIDKNESDWQKALKEEGLEWPNFRSQEVSDLYRVKSVPTMYLIDSKGVLVGTDLRGEALVKKLAELFQ